MGESIPHIGLRLIPRVIRPMLFFGMEGWKCVYNRLGCPRSLLTNKRSQSSVENKGVFYTVSLPQEVTSWLFVSI